MAAAPLLCMVTQAGEQVSRQIVTIASQAEEEGRVALIGFAAKQCREPYHHTLLC